MGGSGGMREGGVEEGGRRQGGGGGREGGREREGERERGREERRVAGLFTFFFLASYDVTHVSTNPSCNAFFIVACFDQFHVLANIVRQWVVGSWRDLLPGRIELWSGAEPVV